MLSVLGEVPGIGKGSEWAPSKKLEQVQVFSLLVKHMRINNEEK